MEIQVGKMYRTRSGELCYVFHKWRIASDDPFIGAQISPEKYEGLPYRQMTYSETGTASFDSPNNDLVEEVKCHFPENKYDSKEVKALKLIANLHMDSNNTLSSMVVPLCHGVLQDRPTFKDKADYSRKWLQGYLIGVGTGWLLVMVSWFLPRLFL